METFKPRDFIALLVLLAVMIYKITGHNGGLDAILTLIIGYYFGKRDEPTLNLPMEMIERRNGPYNIKRM